ncbi:hypothetical protein A2164_00480 [Candidatus Curtissbacteria bacterium RBG_13_35_7]|uniref:HD domain-containing protein n=1 Tax=Candidatus Curtissbacteria bacterium RBG_13_35_7 TaxID=1797705 RepID=A0A1F5G2C4_9BACT|nr:MAG: hypothetical protein A2164_00480 [Candidatus Curtissbacteria bacterium RBG_13_35_7]
MEKEIINIIEKLSKAGYDAVIVGGAVRDILSKQNVNDWDLATSAKPEEILKLFPGSFYNNRFGTVGIKVNNQIVEVTTFRKEQKYSDKRHPDVVIWGKTIEEDLARRDFTINAMAIKISNFKFQISNFKIIDPYDGQKDLKNKLIRTVGDANKRFIEDALRLIRAIRFATTLGFKIEEKTKIAIIKNAKLINNISAERIRDELFKIIEDENAVDGILLCRETGILSKIFPELDECFTVEQKSPKRHHIYDVGTHCLMSLKNCPSNDTIVRLAALLHDTGKAKVARVDKEGVRTFFNHEVITGRQVLNITKRLQMRRVDREKLFKLVRWHQFSVNENQTDKALRRFIRNVGVENVEDMMDLRIGDRLGGGLQQPESWRLKLYRKRLKDVLKKPFTIADLKINGHDVMKASNLKPGPKVGEVLAKLFEEVLDDSKKNNREYLLKRIPKIK